MLTTHYLAQAVTEFLAAPPTPSPTVTTPTGENVVVNTGGAQKFFLQQIAPILLAIVGTFAIVRANRGEVSKVMTSGFLALVGVSIIAGAGALIFLGDDLVDLFIAK